MTDENSLDDHDCKGLVLVVRIKGLHQIMGRPADGANGALSSVDESL